MLSVSSPSHWDQQFLSCRVFTCLLLTDCADFFFFFLNILHFAPLEVAALLPVHIQPVMTSWKLHVSLSQAFKVER